MPVIKVSPPPFPPSEYAIKILRSEVLLQFGIARAKIYSVAALSKTVAVPKEILVPLTVPTIAVPYWLLLTSL